MKYTARQTKQEQNKSWDKMPRLIKMASSNKTDNVKNVMVQLCGEREFYSMYDLYIYKTVC